MNCIIVDDEPLARDIVETYVEKISFLHLSAICKNAFEAISALKENNIDIIFLDIQMPDITGIKFLESIENAPMIIFTTAYEEYALEGFNKNAVDYLLKPISPERFLKAVTKAKDLFDLKSHSPSITDTKDYMFIKVEYQTVKVFFDDILYIEGLKDYVKIHTKKGRILTLLTIKHILEKLPLKSFIRIHKSYIVNTRNIERIERNRIIYGEVRIPVGDAYKDEFYAFLHEK